MRRSLAFALLAGMSAACGAHVTEAEVRKEFEVWPRPGMGLLQALRDASPIRGEDGQTFFGYTYWHVDWRYRYDLGPTGLCAITSVAVKLTVTMTLPVLKQGSAEVAAQFASYLPKLVAHEQGHRRIGQVAAQQVDAAIAQLPPMPNCRLLEAEANRVANELIESGRRENKAYDAATQHGCTQGACMQR